jgi:hypothetical protein
MQRSAARRWLAATGIAAALVVSSAVPAAAEPAPTPALGVVLPDTLIAADSPGTETDPVVVVSQSTILHNLTLKYDVSDVADLVDIGFNDSYCDIDASVITCVYEEESVDPWGSSYIGLTIVPKAGAADGDEGDLKVTASADGLAAVSDTAKVSIGEGVDLAAEIAPDLSQAPGAAYEEKVGVQNVGAVTAHGAVLLFYGDYAIEAGATRYSNCTYDGDQYRACTFEGDLASGKSYGSTFPFRLRADTAAPGRDFIEFVWLTPAEWAAQKTFLQKMGYGDVIGQPGSGPAISLAEKAKAPVEQPEAAAAKSANSPKQVDEDPSNNWTDSTITVTGNQKADVSAFGDTATGAVGAEVEVEFGNKNNGPAAIDYGRGGDYIAEVLFTVPSGSTAVQVPVACYPVVGDEVDFEHPGKAGAAKYLCASAIQLPVGATDTFVFKLRITTATPDAKGEVKVTDFFTGRLDPLIDANPANNVAYVVLNPTAPSTDGPTPGPSTDTNGGGLPVTGTPVIVIAVSGVALLVAGFVLYRTARRRRLTEV